MAPLPLVIPDCPDVAPNTPSFLSGNATVALDGGGVAQDDLSALLYIVVTLLFYSMGIVVGIITYLKRERADMEEEMIFDMYLTMKRDPFNVHRQERVMQMARRLDKMERDKAHRLAHEQRASGGSAAHVPDSDSSDSELQHHSCRRDSGKRCNHVKISDCVPKRSPSARSFRRDSSSGTEGEGTVVYPLVISTANVLVGSTTARSPVSPCSAERPPSVVTTSRQVEGLERRGALPMGASSLHVPREPGESKNYSGPETALLTSGPVVSKPAHVSCCETDDSL